MEESVYPETRTAKDSGGGWGMDLRVQCKQYEKLWSKTKVTIGSSHHNEKLTIEQQDVQENMLFLKELGCIIMKS